uniref:Origin recognition complex subunit 2 n=1 Tax=Heterorhabditis bacteriophora TaxID=37862 RepID=A0A1I7X0F9_HETBA
MNTKSRSKSVGATRKIYPELDIVQEYEYQSDPDDSHFGWNICYEDYRNRFKDLWGILIIVIIAHLIAFFGYKLVVEDVSKLYEEHYRIFKLEALDIIKKKYEWITKDDRTVLRHIGYQLFFLSLCIYFQWLIERAPEPIVLLIAGQKSAEFVTDITRLFASVVKQKRPVSVFHITKDTTRAHLHQQLWEGLGGGNSSDSQIAGLNDVDIMQWDTPLVLHAFADSASFPIERVLLLLSVNQLQEEQGCNCEQRVSQLVFIPY